VHPHTLKSPMAALPGLRQYKIIHHDDRLHVLIVLRDGTPADELPERIEATLGSALLAAGVANPQLEVSIVTELPRAASHSAKFKLIESHSATDSAVPTPTS